MRAISLNEISHATKISVKFLTALEEDRLDLLPGKFFIKGALRAYSRCLGIDEDYILNKYYQETLFQEQQAEEKDSKGGKAVQKKPKSKLVAVLLLLFIFIPAAALSVYLIFLTPSKTGAKAPPRQPQVLPESKTAAPVSDVPEAVFKEEEKKLDLEISFLAETWIQVYADGELKVDGIRFAGEKEHCVALKEIMFNLGNAGGMEYTVNGKKGKPLGPSGAVVKNIMISLENYSQFLVVDEETKKQEGPIR